MSTLAVILTAGLIVRLTRLIVADQLTKPLRTRLVLWLGPKHPIAYLAACSWCMSIWVGAAVCTAAYWWGDSHWWLLAALAGTASLIAGWAANWLDPAEED